MAFARCVCPLYRYATFPTYSSYYAKRCYDGVVSYVSYDTLDVGASPMYNCSAADGGTCDVGCDNFTVQNDSDFEVNRPQIDQIRLKAPCGRDDEPECHHRADVTKSFVVKVEWKPESFFFAKLFTVLIRRQETRFFGLGQETEPNVDGRENFDFLVPYDPSIEITDRYCIRFTVKRIGHERWITADTKFQVITYNSFDRNLVSK